MRNVNLLYAAKERTREETEARKKEGSIEVISAQKAEAGVEERFTKKIRI